MDDITDFVSIELVTMEKACGIRVVFSDNTFAFYPPEELAALRPFRESVIPLTEGGPGRLIRRRFN